MPLTAFGFIANHSKVACLQVCRQAPRVAELVVWLTVCAGLSFSIGTYDQALSKIASYALVAGGLFRALSVQPLRQIAKPLIPALGAIFVWGVFNLIGGSSVIPVLALPIGIMAVYWMRAQGSASHLFVLCRAVTIFGLIYLGWHTVAMIWYGSVALSHWTSFTANNLLLGERHKFGPSVSGLWSWILLGCYTVSWVLETRRWIRFGAAILWSTVSWISLQVLITRPWLVDQKAESIAGFQLANFLLMTLPVLIVCNESPSQSGRPILRSRWTVGVFSLLLFASVFLLIRAPDFPSQRARTLLVYEKGYLDWKVPEFGHYGPFAGGMFGLLPKYLSLENFSVAKFKDEIIGPEILKDHKVLVLINLGKEQGKEWRPDELKTIWQFVRDGGSLLVLGDHTNVFGLQDCFNELLSPVNIRFEFDSAYPCREGWQNCIMARPHPLTANVTNHRSFGIAIGASLTIKPPAFPVVMGRYAFSDEGYVENVMGSYLGNYSYDKGEAMGDMVLVAGAYYGDGKVLVFGDTSMFQNGSWFSNYHPFIHNVVSWLCNSRGLSIDSFAPFLWLAALGSSSVMVAVFSKSLGPFIASYVTTTAFLLAWLGLNASMRPPALWGNLAYFDYSHGPRVNTDSAETTGIGGFLTNLDRTGYLSLKLEQFDPERILASQVYSTVAPVKRYSPQEVEVLLRFMQQGGLIIAAAGYHEKGGIEPLLHALGLDVANVPLGPIPLGRTAREAEADPRFVDAYPVVALPGSLSEEGQKLTELTEPLYTYGDFTPAVLRRHGKGGLVFFGDTRYLSNLNIEGMQYGYKLGNILFLKRILEHAKKVE